jgi:hypothetical protein
MSVRRKRMREPTWTSIGLGRESFSARSGVSDGTPAISRGVSGPDPDIKSSSYLQAASLLCASFAQIEPSGHHSVDAKVKATTTNRQHLL